MRLEIPNHIVEFLIEHTHPLRLIQEELGRVTNQRQIKQHTTILLLITHIRIIHEVLNLRIVLRNDLIIDFPVVLL